MSPIAPTNTAGNAYLNRAYAISSPEEAVSVYDDWAATFDADMKSPTQEYVAPLLVADAVAKYLPAANHTQILDGGCGTGLGGLAITARLKTRSSSSSSLCHVNSTAVDGVDLSPGMLKIAEKTGVYRSLKTANLNQPLDCAGIQPSSYDAVICVGTLTHGHVGPAVLSEFVHVIKCAGVVAATVLNDIWESGGYRAEVDKLTHDGIVTVLENDIADYRRGARVKARLLVLQKKKDVGCGSGR